MPPPQDPNAPIDRPVRPLTDQDRDAITEELLPSLSRIDPEFASSFAKDYDKDKGRALYVGMMRLGQAAQEGNGQAQTDFASLWGRIKSPEVQARSFAQEIGRVPTAQIEPSAARTQEQAVGAATEKRYGPAAKAGQLGNIQQQAYSRLTGPLTQQQYPGAADEVNRVADMSEGRKLAEVAALKSVQATPAGLVPEGVTRSIPGVGAGQREAEEARRQMGVGGELATEIPSQIVGWLTWGRFLRAAKFVPGFSQLSSAIERRVAGPLGKFGAEQLAKHAVEKEAILAKNAGKLSSTTQRLGAQWRQELGRAAVRAGQAAETLPGAAGIYGLETAAKLATGQPQPLKPNMMPLYGGRESLEEFRNDPQSGPLGMALSAPGIKQLANLESHVSLPAALAYPLALHWGSAIMAKNMPTLHALFTGKSVAQSAADLAAGIKGEEPTPIIPLEQRVRKAREDYEAQQGPPGPGQVYEFKSRESLVGRAGHEHTGLPAEVTGFLGPKEAKIEGLDKRNIHAAVVKGLADGVTRDEIRAKYNEPLNVGPGTLRTVDIANAASVRDRVAELEDKEAGSAEGPKLTSDEIQELTTLKNVQEVDKYLTNRVANDDFIDPRKMAMPDHFVDMVKFGSAQTEPDKYGRQVPTAWAKSCRRQLILWRSIELAYRGGRPGGKKGKQGASEPMPPGGAPGAPSPTALGAPPTDPDVAKHYAKLQKWRDKTLSKMSVDELNKLKTQIQGYKDQATANPNTLDQREAQIVHINEEMQARQGGATAAAAEEKPAEPTPAAPTPPPPKPEGGGEEPPPTAPAAPAPEGPPTPPAPPAAPAAAPPAEEPTQPLADVNMAKVEQHVKDKTYRHSLRGGKEEPPPKPAPAPPQVSPLDRNLAIKLSPDETTREEFQNIIHSTDTTDSVLQMALKEFNDEIHAGKGAPPEHDYERVTPEVRDEQGNVVKPSEPVGKRPGVPEQIPADIEHHPAKPGFSFDPAQVRERYALSTAVDTGTLLSHTGHEAREPGEEAVSTRAREERKQVAVRRIMREVAQDSRKEDMAKLVARRREILSSGEKPSPEQQAELKALNTRLRDLSVPSLAAVPRIAERLRTEGYPVAADELAKYHEATLARFLQRVAGETGEAPAREVTAREAENLPTNVRGTQGPFAITKRTYDFSNRYNADEHTADELLPEKAAIVTRVPTAADLKQAKLPTFTNMEDAIAHAGKEHLTADELASIRTQRSAEATSALAEHQYYTSAREDLRSLMRKDNFTMPELEEALARWEHKPIGQAGGGVHLPPEAIERLVDLLPEMRTRAARNTSTRMFRDMPVNPHEGARFNVGPGAKGWEGGFKREATATVGGRVDYVKELQARRDDIRNILDIGRLANAEHYDIDMEGGIKDRGADELNELRPSLIGAKLQVGDKVMQLPAEEIPMISRDGDVYTIVSPGNKYPPINLDDVRIIRQPRPDKVDPSLGKRALDKEQIYTIGSVLAEQAGKGDRARLTDEGKALLARELPKLSNRQLASYYSWLDELTRPDVGRMRIGRRMIEPVEQFRSIIRHEIDERASGRTKEAEGEVSHEAGSPRQLERMRRFLATSQRTHERNVVDRMREMGEEVTTAKPRQLTEAEQIAKFVQEYRDSNQGRPPDDAAWHELMAKVQHITPAIGTIGQGEGPLLEGDLSIDDAGIVRHFNEPEEGDELTPDRMAELTGRREKRPTTRKWSKKIAEYYLTHPGWEGNADVADDVHKLIAMLKDTVSAPNLAVPRKSGIKLTENVWTNPLGDYQRHATRIAERLAARLGTDRPAINRLPATPNLDHLIGEGSVRTRARGEITPEELETAKNAVLENIVRPATTSGDTMRAALSRVARRVTDLGFSHGYNYQEIASLPPSERTINESRFLELNQTAAMSQRYAEMLDVKYGRNRLEPRYEAPPRGATRETILNKIKQGKILTTGVGLDGKRDGTPNEVGYILRTDPRTALGFAFERAKDLGVKFNASMHLLVAQATQGEAGKERFSVKKAPSPTFKAGELAPPTKDLIPPDKVETMATYPNEAGDQVEFPEDAVLVSEAPVEGVRHVRSYTPTEFQVFVRAAKPDTWSKVDKIYVHPDSMDKILGLYLDEAAQKHAENARTATKFVENMLKKGYSLEEISQMNAQEGEEGEEESEQAEDVEPDSSYEASHYKGPRWRIPSTFDKPKS